MYNAQETLIPTFIHSIVMYMMIGASLVVYGLKGQLKPTVFSWWYFSFLVLCLISASLFLNADDWILYDMLVSLIISYCFILNLQKISKIVAIMTVFVFSALVMSVQLWATGQLEYLFIASEMMEHSRLGAEVTGNANIFANLFMYAGVFASWLMVYASNKKLVVPNLIFLCLILLMMAISGGRKTIIAVVATLVLFFLLKKDSKNKTRYGRNFFIAAVLVTGIFVAIFNVPFLYDLVGARFEGLMDMFQGKGAHVPGDETRGVIFQMAFEGWLDSPLFGYGIDSFKYYNMQTTGHHFYAHNNYVELLFDVGIIGFVVYYWIYYYIIKQLRRMPIELYRFKVLGYGLLFELFIFDFGGVGYYLNGSIILLSISYCCTRLKTIQQ